MWYERNIGGLVREYYSQFPAILITGSRQVGKTSLLKHLFPDFDYVTLDLPTNAGLAKDNPELFLAQYNRPVIIDEVQYAPELLRYLKVAIDKDRKTNGQFVLTGSQKFHLMQGVSESLAGRCGVLELEGLSIQELSPLSSGVIDIVIKGGFPELHAIPEKKASFFLDSYLGTYLERDIRNLLKVQNLRDFERFIRACAYRSSQLLNKSELAKDVGISPTTANDWLNLLIASNQIYLLEPWFENSTKQMIKAPKIYLADSGLMCHLHNIKTSEDFHSSPVKGYIWETFVFSELRKQQSWQQARPHIWMLRTLQKKEVDFVILKAGKLHFIETKFNPLPQTRDLKTLLNLEEIIPEKYVASKSVITSTSSLSSVNGITVYPVEDLPAEMWF